MKKSLFWLLALVLSPVAVLVVITPMDSQKQYIFGLLSIGILFLMGFSKRRSVSVIMVVTSLLMSTRYMYFRLTQTLHFNSSIEAILGMGLFLAEVYIWVMLLLNYLQTVWPLKRGIVPLPDDMSKWPTVDIYIPSYNEPLEVVRDTVLAAQCIDYPKDKMKIYLLDDGKRSEFAVFAADVGVGYITRNDNKHAKAGNLNHALTLTQGELICVFDCDHVATRVFLQATVGGFLKDPMLALVQTPHYFYSPDPFERNLSVGRNIPNEGMLFYGPIQQGNDNWNATFFCGSCAVIRREALAQIGGFAVETVTEDAHTALKFQRLGWKSAFLDIPLAAGLATERLVVHVIQRTRWARGMTQIFRVDNPLFGRGLTFQQRLCYLSAMLYYQFALPRVVFVTASLAYLLFNLNIIYSSASLIVSYALPHLFLAIYVGSRMNGRYRYSFWGEIYDIVLAFHLVLPTLVTMIFPKRGKFNVTDKGGLLDVGYFDFTVVRPHLVVACLLALGVIVGIVRAIGHDYFGSDPNVIALNVGWGIYSLIFLLAAGQVGAACQWPAWEQFKQAYVSPEGRVIDPSDARKISTSEGQSYGLFFVLAANDRAGFDKLLTWTQNNLAEGDLKQHLPGWLWGKKDDEQWTLLDSNSASDSDLWIAWALLEAGRLWQQPQYTETGKALLARIVAEETVAVPGLGTMLLPGKVGFADDSGWRFNPSYLPPQLATYFVRFGAPWPALRDSNLRLLLETAPKGFTPDWVRYEKGKGWQLKTEKPPIGSYDAIRVYLWVGMLHDGDKQKARLLQRFTPMAAQTTKQGVPPEKVNIATGKTSGQGPVGFSAAMLPFLQDDEARSVQRQRVADNYPGADAYYSAVLTLFGQGWDQHRFRFTASGELQPDWNQECASSH
ncbi:TPA: UDP-forming cellulose synthase catalytic subunit [Klebsiella pneumoniae]|nr:UDP-forming cellulose synthase catalytic subunit [Klebsiella pneumoniae]